jgi:hypothetical protein
MGTGQVSVPLKPRRTRLILVHPLTVEALPHEGEPSGLQTFHLTTCDGVHDAVVGFVPTFPGEQVDVDVLQHKTGNVLVQFIAARIRRGEPA